MGCSFFGERCSRKARTVDFDGVEHNFGNAPADASAVVVVSASDVFNSRLTTKENNAVVRNTDVP